MTYIEKYASGIMVPKFHYAHIDYGYPNRLFCREIACLHPTANFSMNPIVNIKLLQINCKLKFSSMLNYKCDL